MDTRQELQVQKKARARSEAGDNDPCACLCATADIYESQDALTVILEVPDVQKHNVEVRVEEGTLHHEGRLDLAKYQGLVPLYTEYNIGHYARSFRLSSKIDQTKIAADLKDGVLSLTLPKAAEAKPRTIKVK
jgi:HSP20 family molecular chaperone IbpA